MVKRVGILIFFGIVTSLFLVNSALAATFEPNNKVGVHVSSPTDQNIREACRMINAGGGAWGYMTLVMAENDRNQGKWQNVFNIMRDCKAIPIVRLASSPQGGFWRRPDPKAAGEWASFLDGLNWPVRERYVILFNEPNHGAEWGGGCDGADYAHTAAAVARKIKEKNKDFFLMLAGLDQSAPNQPPRYCSEEMFLREIIKAEPEIFSLVDGLSSHSYPNPAFSASPHARGRGSIQGYSWELGQLQALGVSKIMPVFITETGWSRQFLTTQQVAFFYQQGMETVWLPDGRVRAVTPFDFQIGPPFENFSFRIGEGNPVFNLQYGAISSLAKQKGDPPQRQRAQILATLPKLLVADSVFSFQVWLKNEGQAIWDRRDGHRLGLIESVVDHSFSDIYNIKPNDAAVSTFTFRPGKNLGKQTVRVALFKETAPVLELFTYQYTIVTKPRVFFQASTFPGFKARGENFEFQVFDKAQKLVYKQKQIRVVGGGGEIPEVLNVALDECYRVVLLRDYYLPVQKECVRFGATPETIKFPSMVRVDRNKDGKFSFADLLGN